MFLIAASLLFAHPAPLDMPRAEAYFVRSTSGEMRLEDRYSRDDLWTSHAVLGRWEDDDGRMFTVSRLDTVPPKFSSDAVTRTEYTANIVRINPDKDFDLRDQAIDLLSPVEITDAPARPRQMPRNWREVLYFEGTNALSIVCAFLREDEEPRVWRLATWELCPGDDREWAREIFEEEFLGKWDEVVAHYLLSEAPQTGERKSAKSKRREEIPSERDLLRIDARHSVTNYSSWRVTEAEEFSVLDALVSHGEFIESLTNDMSRMRRRYAEVMPSPVNGSNVLCIARIFSDRIDYLAAAGEDMAWSAAYWNPMRRELVAYLPDSGEQNLLRTIRHEAFHQYFSYASSMLSPSPWINEGYAQYFEDEDSLDWSLQSGRNPTPEELDQYAEILPALLIMDYEEFYAGDSASRNLKYRLAWSIAVFIEKGAPKVRFRPFEDLKKSYVASLLKTKDMRKATAKAFVSQDKLDLFVKEWKKFWKNM